MEGPVEEEGRRLRESHSFRRMAKVLSTRFKKRKDDGSAFFLSLPTELTFRIFTYLDSSSLLEVSHVCPYWNEVSYSPSLWRNLYQQDFQVTTAQLKSEQLSWKGFYLDTSEKFKKLSADIHTRPDDVNIYIQRAQEHSDLGHYSVAASDLTTALDIKNGDPEKNQDTPVGVILLRRALNYRHMKENKKAEADVAKAISLDAENPHYYRIRGNWRREDKDLSGALEDYALAISLQPTGAVNHFCSGLVYKDQKNYVCAINCLNTAIQLEPENANYRCSRGRMHSQVGAYEDAIKDLDYAITLDPNNSDYLHWRGRIFRENQECEKALKDFEQALSITKDDIDFAWCSIMYSQIKDNKKSLHYINKAIEMAPENSFHHQFKGILNFGLGHNEVGMESFNAAINLYPNWSGHYVWRAAVYCELGEIALATDDLDTAVHLKADETSLFWRGLLHLGLKEFTKAKYDLLAAMHEAENPCHSRILFWLGVAHSLDNEKERAQELWEQTLKTANKEVRVAHYNEPARVALVAHEDEKQARKFYTQFFQAQFTVDNMKTESVHLILLSSLFPTNKAIANVAHWFEQERERYTGTINEERCQAGVREEDGISEKKQYEVMGK